MLENVLFITSGGVMLHLKITIKTINLVSSAHSVLFLELLYGLPHFLSRGLYWKAI